MNIKKSRQATAEKVEEIRQDESVSHIKKPSPFVEGEGEYLIEAFGSYALWLVLQLITIKSM